MSDTYTQIYVHAVWSTKRRRPMIAEACRARLHAYIAGVGRRLGAIVFEVNGVEDHVHVLAGLPPTMAVPNLIGQMKKRSSLWMRRQMKVDQFSWQEGYGVFSVSHSMLPRVQRYIQCQEEHHRGQSFDDEYDVLMRHHGL